MNAFNEKFRLFLASKFKWIIGLTLIISIAFLIDLYLKGIDYYSFSVFFFIIVGFILSISPNKYSHLGSFLMAFSTLHLMFLSLLAVFSTLHFAIQIAISIALAGFSLIVLHVLTIKRKLMPSKFESLFFGVLAYIITTLFLLAAFGGVDLESNLFLFSVTTMFIVFSFLVVINRSFREKEILRIIDISDLNVYYKLSEHLKQTFVDCDKKTEIIASDFRSSIDSFIAGDFKKAIEYSYICLEGVKRLLEWKKSIILTKTQYSKDYIQVREWRNKLAHSSVSKKPEKNDDENGRKNPIGYVQAFTAIKTTKQIISNIDDVDMETDYLEESKRLRLKEKRELYAELSSELQPFLEEIKKLPKDSSEYQNFRDACRDFKVQSQSKKQLFSSILPNGLHVAKLKDNLYSLFIYLGMVESVGKKMIDILVLVLVANGHVFRANRTTPSTMQELDDDCIPLGTKLAFLKREGLPKVASVIDKQFRNDIAHLNFQIRDNAAYINGVDASGTALINLYKLSDGVEIIDNLLVKLDTEMGLT